MSRMTKCFEVTTLDHLIKLKKLFINNQLF